jgi:hypothetical protein
VVGPNDKKIMTGEKERQGDFVFTAQTAGEYRVCFNNEMSTFADKMVDFEVAVRFTRGKAMHEETTQTDGRANSGRRRIQIRAPATKGRLVARATFRPRGSGIQDQRTAEHSQSHAEILPYAGES